MKFDEAILEEIIEAAGNCLNGIRCHKCPFMNQCMTEFMSRRPPSRPKRLKMALDALAEIHLIGDDGSWKTTPK